MPKDNNNKNKKSVKPAKSEKGENVKPKKTCQANRPSTW